MNRVLKLQSVGLINPTVVEYEGKVLATNQLDIESTCNLWRCHFGFYPIEKIDLAMTKKNFSVIQQKSLSSVKSVYDLFYERNFIPKVFDSNEEVSKWGVYRTNEVEKLKSENAALRERLEKSVERLKAREKSVCFGTEWKAVVTDEDIDEVFGIAEARLAELKGERNEDSAGNKWNRRSADGSGDPCGKRVYCTARESKGFTGENGRGSRKRGG